MMRPRILTLLVVLAALWAALPATASAQRYVALSPFTANILSDLGVRPVAIGDTLGGQDRFSPRLAGVRRLALSHPNGPNIEQLAALNPDVVVSAPIWNRGHRTMQRLGMRVVSIDPTSVREAVAATRQLGKLTGRTRAAKRVARKQRREIRAARRGIRRRPSVLLVLGVGRQPYAFLRGSWGADIVEKAGGRLLTQGLRGSADGFAQISNETIVSRNPDVIIAVPHGNAKDIPGIAEYLARNPAWRTTRAVRNGRVYISTGNSLLQAYTDVGRTILDVRKKYLKNI